MNAEEYLSYITNNDNYSVGGTYNWTIKYKAIILRISYDTLNDVNKQLLDNLYNSIMNLIEAYGGEINE